MRLAIRVITIVTVVALLVGENTQRVAAHYNYTGTGTWGTSSLQYYDWTGGASAYSGPTDGAALDWHGWTDLELTETAPDYEDIGVWAYNFGSANPVAKTVICDQFRCSSFPPFNYQFLYAEVDFNTQVMDGYSYYQKQAVASHEFGHTFSLHHVDDTNPPHIMYASPKYIYDTYGIYYSTAHDIDAVNARY